MENENQLVQFDQLKAEVTGFASPALAVRVVDKITQDTALVSARQVVALKKMIEAKRVELTSPLNQRVKEINAYAASLAAPLVKAEAHIKSQLVVHETKLAKERAEEAARIERERLEAQKKIDEDAKRARDAADLFSQDPVEVAAPIEEKVAIDTAALIQTKAIDSNKVSGSSRAWVFELTDASLVPDKYKIVDERLIRSAIRDGEREIPGVRIFQEVRVAIR